MGERVGQGLADTVVRVLGHVHPPHALHPWHQEAVAGDQARTLVDDPDDRTDQVGPVPELGALM